MSASRTGSAATLAVLVLALLWGTADPALGQSRGSTGRHRSASREIPEEKDQPEPRPGSGWSLQAGAGSVGGGDLFRAEVVSGAAVPWTAGSGASFQTSRFTAALGRNPGVGLAVLRSLGARGALRLELGYAKVDVKATALVGQGGAVFLYDRAGIFSLGLGLEWDLAAVPSPPYLALLAGRRSLSPEEIGGLAGTALEVSAVLGFRQRIGVGLHAVVEGRVGRAGLDLEGFSPPPAAGFAPEVDLTLRDHLTILEIRLGLRKIL